MDNETGLSFERLRLEKPVIKTIHVTEIKRNGSSDYISYDGVNLKAFHGLFSKFGTVNSVRSRCNRCHNCCTVEFNDEQAAAQLLIKHQLSFNGSTFKVTTNDKFYQLSSDDANGINDIGPILQPPPAQDSPEHILNRLNEDCLCAIFEKLDHLADFDAVANVCTQFHKIGKLVFPSKIRSRVINFDNFAFDDGFQYDTIALAQIQNFLLNFGPSIVSLSFRSFYLERTPDSGNLALKMIHKHCKNITNLEIEILNDHYEVANEIRSIFSRLKRLHIKLHINTLLPDILPACTEIEELIVERLKTENSNFMLPDISFPYLRKLDCIDVLLNTQFFELNLQIEELNIGKARLSDYFNTIPFICQNLLDLKKVTTRLYGHLNMNFRSNPTINLCAVNCYNINHVAHLQNITQISMEVWAEQFGQFDSQFINVTRDLHNLEKIEYTGIIFLSDTLKQMMQHANNLLTLEVYHGFASTYRFNETDYREILPMVLAREPRKKLEITLKYSVYTGKRNDWHEKLKVLNEHPNLTIFIKSLNNKFER